MGVHGYTTLKAKLIEDLQDGSYTPGDALAALRVVMPVSQRREPTKKKNRTASIGLNDIASYHIQETLCASLGVNAKHGSIHSKSIDDVAEQYDSGFRYAYALGWQQLLCSCSTQVDYLVDLVSRETSSSREITSLLHRYLNSSIGLNQLSPYEAYEVFKANPLLQTLFMKACTIVRENLSSRGLDSSVVGGRLIVYFRSERAAKRSALASIRFLKKQLHANISIEALCVEPLVGLECGYFTLDLTEDGACQVGCAKSAVSALKEEVRKITSRSNGESYDHRARRLRACLHRWATRLRGACANGLLSELNAWLLKRVNLVILRQQKRVRSRIAFFEQIGCRLQDAFKAANSRAGWWAIVEHYPELFGGYSQMKRFGFSFLKAY